MERCYQETNAYHGPRSRNFNPRRPEVWLRSPDRSQSSALDWIPNSRAWGGMLSSAMSATPTILRVS